ncbi:HET-domain-containing protein, partial [Macroventuria anomochaeta]
MYLLQTDDNGELIHEEIMGRNVPPYAILSHTWSENHKDEVSFKDIAKGRGKDKQGYDKLRFCAKQATDDDLKHFWVDTCCIDKSSSAELQEAINSMFRWYQNSAKCYVYLADVSCEALWMSKFRQSRWFTRGWTLQELLAPNTVEFFSAEGSKLGDKYSLAREIHKITRIPREAFLGIASSLTRFSVEERISWSDYRTTTRDEDKAYSLLGLFDLHIALLYGEGEDNAFRRLHEE